MFQRIGIQLARALKVVQRINHRHTGSRNRSCASATICLNHIAVHSDRALSQQLEIQRGTQGATNESLNFNRSATLLAARCLPVHPRSGRARQHTVLGGQPPLALPPQKTGYASAHTRRTNHLCLPKRHQHRALSVTGVSPVKLNGPHGVRGTATGPVG